MLQTTSDQVIYKTRAVGPSTFIKAPLLPTARQLRKRWNQHIQLLGNGIKFLNQPSRSHRAINHAVVVGQLASIQQIKLPPFKVNKLLELDVIAQSPFDSCNHNSRKYGYDESAFLKEGMVLTGRVGAIGQ